MHSNAVLEHVRDPAACAREMVRVLKPGGDLMCCVPFLQPYHGYPHHALLPPEKNRELACANTLFARKPGAGGAGLRCDRAIYGAGTTWLDVTAAVTRFAGEHHLFISCSEDVALFGDPAPGVPKQLRVAWRRGEAVGAGGAAGDAAVDLSR